MLDRTNCRKEASCVKSGISQVFKPRPVKRAAPGFDRVVLRALSVKLNARTAGLGEIELKARYTLVLTLEQLSLYLVTKTQIQRKFAVYLPVVLKEAVRF